MITIKAPSDPSLRERLEKFVAADQLAAARHNLGLAAEIRRVGKKARKAARAVRNRALQRQALQAGGEA